MKKGVSDIFSCGLGAKNRRRRGIHLGAGEDANFQAKGKNWVNAKTRRLVCAKLLSSSFRQEGWPEAPRLRGDDPFIGRLFLDC